MPKTLLLTRQFATEQLQQKKFTITMTSVDNKHTIVVVDSNFKVVIDFTLDENDFERFHNAEMWSKFKIKLMQARLIKMTYLELLNQNKL